MAVKIVVVLALAAVVTAIQVPAWSSNVALWSAAVKVNPSSPRPAFNLGLSYQLQGDYSAAVQWFDRAVQRAAGTPAEAEYLGRVRGQVIVLESFGVFPCGPSATYSFCR